MVWISVQQSDGNATAMSPATDFGVDLFPCGCIVTDRARNIVFTNRYLTDEFSWPAGLLIGGSIERLLSPASHIFCEGFVFPMLEKKGKCQEIQLTILTRDGRRVPVLANAKVSQGNDGVVVWSIFAAENRDRVYDELVSARERLEEKTRQLTLISSTDELTGLMNRRTFDATVREMFADANRTGCPVSVLLLDIDDFKCINDTYGHQTGDRVLQDTGRRIAEQCGPNDTVARYGGEEIVFGLRGRSSEEALSFATKIHSAVNSVTVAGRPVTASIGICSRPGTSRVSYGEVLAQADKALYAAKHAGKNRTRIGLLPDQETSDT